MTAIYLALDFSDWETTEQFLNEHDLRGVPVKIGMELYYREGPRIIEKLKQNKHPLFLDLKLHDIPTTVYRTMRNLAQFDVDVVNVHALGGAEMIKQAKAGLVSGSRPGHETKLLAVTLLTSHDDQMINEELLIQGNIADHALHLAKLAKENGADGVVCSVHEAAAIKAVCGEDFLTVTPGIRLAGSEHDDQKRIATPEVARQLGADTLVIGRSITNALEPKKAYEQAQEAFIHDIK